MMLRNSKIIAHGTIYRQSSLWTIIFLNMNGGFFFHKRNEKWGRQFAIFLVCLEGGEVLDTPPPAYQNSLPTYNQAVRYSWPLNSVEWRIDLVWDTHHTGQTMPIIKLPKGSRKKGGSFLSCRATKRGGGLNGCVTKEKKTFL